MKLQKYFCDQYLKWPIFSHSVIIFLQLCTELCFKVDVFAVCQNIVESFSRLDQLCTAEWIHSANDSIRQVVKAFQQGQPESINLGKGLSL